MVVLVVATASDPASIGPAAAFLAMPGWSPGPPIPEGMESFTNGDVRLLKHERSIIAEDDLDHRWQAATGEAVSEVIFLSKHTAVSNRPALTVHPIGVPHLREDETPPQGGRPGWAALPNPRIGPWLRLMQKIAVDQGLVPEFEITLEATHHGPVTNTPTMFVEIGSTEDYWCRQDAAQAIALVESFSQFSSTVYMFFVLHFQEELRVLWKGLGLDEGNTVGSWQGLETFSFWFCGVEIKKTIYFFRPKITSFLATGISISMEEKRPNRIGGVGINSEKVLLGIGGGHYAPRHMDIVIKDGVWVGHLLSGYSLPMEVPPQGNGKSSSDIGGMWKHSIKVSYDATKAAFPGGQVIAHLDQKSFKGWQKNAVMSYLQELNIRIGKPNDFI
uniref:D-aminoacyl-tRNA deacylase n=1 Tax=Oryza punctata TaxID=4537 RepID=A0A0E0LYS6_ORYPU